MARPRQLSSILPRVKLLRLALAAAQAGVSQGIRDLRSPMRAESIDREHGMLANNVSRVFCHVEGFALALDRVHPATLCELRPSQRALQSVLAAECLPLLDLLTALKGLFVERLPSTVISQRLAAARKALPRIQALLKFGLVAQDM